MSSCKPSGPTFVEFCMFRISIDLIACDSGVVDCTAVVDKLDVTVDSSVFDVVLDSVVDDAVVRVDVSLVDDKVVTIQVVVLEVVTLEVSRLLVVVVLSGYGDVSQLIKTPKNDAKRITQAMVRP